METSAKTSKELADSLMRSFNGDPEAVRQFNLRTKERYKGDLLTGSLTRASYEANLRRMAEVEAHLPSSPKRP